MKNAESVGQRIENNSPLVIFKNWIVILVKPKGNIMKLILEKEEALTIIHSALCNGGLSELRYSDVVLSVNKEDYQQAKQELIDGGIETICIEDVWVQILRAGKPLQFFDEGCEEAQEFNLDKAIEEMSKEEALDVVICIKEEQDDAYTGFELLQFCLYGEVIFG